MSVIFGICSTQGCAVDKRALSCLALATAQYGQDGTYTRIEGTIGFAFQAFHTHNRSQLEHRPLKSEDGNIVALDGRLDNHEDLCAALGIDEKPTSDSLIILKA